MVTAAQVIAKARTQKGVTEKGFSNVVKFNDEFWGKGKYGSWAAWCVVFQWWVFKECGASALIPRTAGVAVFFQSSNLARYGMKKIAKSSLKPGDLVRHTYSHIGLVTKAPSGGYVTTIAGNTSPGSGGSQRDGGGVWEKRVPLSTIQYGFRPKYSSKSTTVPTTGGILDMGISNAGQVKKAVTIPKGKWVYLPVNDKGDMTIMSGVKNGDGWLAHGNFTFTGVPAGKNVQVRFVLDSYKKGTTTKRIATYPPQELPSDGGKTMGAASQLRKNVHSPGSGRTLRVRAQAWAPVAGVKLTGALYAAGK